MFDSLAAAAGHWRATTRSGGVGLSFVVLHFQ